ncbi:MAG: hypothetical protein J6W56_07895 [Prevotella sp.]|nr:hypothetical protein [Prevotella sp.]
MDINDLYSYIRQNTTDDYDILKNKIDEFSHEGLEPIRIYNIISQYIALKPFCRALDVINGDYIEFIKAIKIATFLKAKFNNENAISVMQKTLVYEDNNVCIFKPTNFQESSIIGEPICCFAYSQGRWDEHYNAYEEAIYYVFDVMRENSIHDFVAITVRPNGRALVLDKNHNWWSPADSIRYIQGLGEGASTIVTKEGKSIKTENKQYNNMNKRLIKLTEQDLHKIVKESVHKILKETSEYYDSNLDEGVYLTAGWLSDMLEAIDKEERGVSMNGQQPQLRAEGMRMALEIIKDHI